MRRMLAAVVILAIIAVVAALEVRPAGPAQAAVTVQAPFNASYTFFSLGSVPGLLTSYGGLTILPSNTNKLLIGGSANTAGGRIYSIDLVRDGSNHITGFSGTASIYSWGAYNDGTVLFGPGGVLFVTEYSVNKIGELKPGVPNTSAYDKDVGLTALGVGAVGDSVGSLNFVPAGFPGAGSLKIWTYSDGNWYTASASSDGSGTWDITGATLKATTDVGPEGFIFIPPGSPIFPANSILVSEYGNDQVATYTLDSNGDINVGSRQLVLDGLTGAEGAFIDPVTGDFLFSTFGQSNTVSELRGFAAPNAPTATPTVTGTPLATATAVPTTAVIRQNVGGAAGAVAAAAGQASARNRTKAAAAALALTPTATTQVRAPSTGTGISPPNTGDAGLKGSGRALPGALAALALIASLAGLHRGFRRG